MELWASPCSKLGEAFCTSAPPITSTRRSAGSASRSSAVARRGRAAVMWSSLAGWPSRHGRLNLGSPRAPPSVAAARCSRGAHSGRRIRPQKNCASVRANGLASLFGESCRRDRKKRRRYSKISSSSRPGAMVPRVRSSLWNFLSVNALPSRAFIRSRRAKIFSRPMRYDNGCVGDIV